MELVVLSYSPDRSPTITVVVNAGWSKRSHKHSYNAKSGDGIIVGVETKKLLHVGVHNKYCSVPSCKYTQCTGLTTNRIQLTGKEASRKNDKPSDPGCPNDPPTSVLFLSLNSFSQSYPTCKTCCQAIDGKRVFSGWQLMLPHFKACGTPQKQCIFSSK